MLHTRSNFSFYFIVIRYVNDLMIMNVVVYLFVKLSSAETQTSQADNTSAPSVPPRLRSPFLVLN